MDAVEKQRTERSLKVLQADFYDSLEDIREMLSELETTVDEIISDPILNR